MQVVEQLLSKSELAEVFLSELPSGKRKIRVEKVAPDLHIPFPSCETAYPTDLIKLILKAKGPAYLCDEILRDESPQYVQHDLKWSVLSYVSEQQFQDKRILDFGCGSGGSSATLARMLPNTQIVGVELEARLLEVARARIQHYGFNNITFHVSPAPDKLPDQIGKFDFVMFSAVFEHLLPAERTELLPLIWSALKPGGVLFLNGTPNRHFPMETHTTGLPAINYLPDSLAHWVSRKFSRRNLQNDSWEKLLRKGIRGGSFGEVLDILSATSEPATVMEPQFLGINDRIDLWLAMSSKNIDESKRPLLAKRIYRQIMKPVKALTGVELLPELALALKKAGSNQPT